MLGAATIVFALIAASLIVGYMVRRPPLTAPVKLALLAGLGVFPIAAAMAGNLQGFEASKSVDFCSSCHVMGPYVADARNPKSESLASFHTRNGHFGTESCYICHADYGMFGTVTTKLEGTRHLYMYDTRYRNADAETLKIELYKPFPNTTCMGCHSTTLPGWLDEPEHQPVLEDVRNGSTSCASDGCHGPAHLVKGKTK